ncbi:MAG: DNA repair protein RadA [Clostridiales Family XIII bacterium]|jgi:DNA repair protein RadA/Sms|nr:DNA repair protein RadA [Clostridiales Family XIII bacterium]
MAKKPKTVYVCTECGNEFPKWQGQCICGAWNTLHEERIIEEKDDKRSRSLSGRGLSSGIGSGIGASSGFGQGSRRRTTPKVLKEVTSSGTSRISTGIGEFDRVLGGGIVPGSLALISGEPGIGKSTIILQACINIAKNRGTSPFCRDDNVTSERASSSDDSFSVLYISGEESEEQIKIRADRINDNLPDNLYILSETTIENIVDIVNEKKPSFLIIDSIQTMYSETLESSSGTVSQIRACSTELMRIAKVLDIPIFIVAHVTKSGDLAGPKVIEHLVDCVLLFTGERSQDLRILRASKNRFGTTNEIGAFEMRETGLSEIVDVAGSFLEGLEEPQEGTIATAVIEGTRPLLLELQALTSKAGQGFARRTSIGVEASRLSMILAVLEKKINLDLSMHDVYLNVVGGLRPEGTTMDLAVALSLYSSAKGLLVDEKTIAFGEIGLTGDLRSIRNCDRVVKEAIKLGFTTIILPSKNALSLKQDKAILKDIKSKSVRVVGAKNLASAIKNLYS